MSTKSKKTIEFAPIQDARRGYTHLQIYPPGTWFDRTDFRVFVGGCERGGRKTLAVAKAFLLAEAIVECDSRIARAKHEMEHYEHERKVLVERGLRPLGGSRRR